MKICICIVLYNCSLKESRAVQALVRHAEYLNDLDVNIFLNGNSTADCQTSCALFNIHNNNGENLFLLKNYTRCLQFAGEKNINWIVFFDQDTEISIDYLQELNNALVNTNDQVAFFPYLKARSKPVSPLKLFHGLAYPKKVLKTGTHSAVDFVGLNSGSVYKVEFLMSIGPISEQFRLDYLDIYLSFRLFKSNKPFSILNVTLEHDLSILNDEPLSDARARSILSAEYYYFKEYRGFLSYLLYKLRLVLMLRKAIFRKNFIYKKSVVLEYLFK